MTDPIRNYIDTHIPENHRQGDGCWDAAQRAMRYGPWSKAPHGNPCDHYAAGTYEADEVDGIQRCPRCGATRQKVVA